MIKKKTTRPTKTVKVYEDTHARLKIHSAKKKGNITEIASLAIDNHIKPPKKES